MRTLTTRPAFIRPASLIAGVSTGSGYLTPWGTVYIAPTLDWVRLTGSDYWPANSARGYSSAHQTLHSHQRNHIAVLQALQELKAELEERV